jgi:hypothetical protein
MLIYLAERLIYEPFLHSKSWTSERSGRGAGSDERKCVKLLRFSLSSRRNRCRVSRAGRRHRIHRSKVKIREKRAVGVATKGLRCETNLIGMKCRVARDGEMRWETTLPRFDKLPFYDDDSNLFSRLHSKQVYHFAVCFICNNCFGTEIMSNALVGGCWKSRGRDWHDKRRLLAVQWEEWRAKTRNVEEKFFFLFFVFKSHLKKINWHLNYGQPLNNVIRFDICCWSHETESWVSDSVGNAFM